MKKTSDLTDNFGRWEFFVDREFPDLARKAMYLRNMDLVDDRLYLQTKSVLQPTRNFIGERIIINSGYRNKELNEANGGKPNSLHLRAKATDFTLDNKEKLLFCYEFIKNELGDRICELFLYFDKNGNPRFIHSALADINKKEPKVGFLEV